MTAARANGDLVFLAAGEPSGDVLGARLMAAMKREYPGPLRFAGVGGLRMAAEGLDSLFPMDELSVMGLAEVLPRIPRLLGRLRQTAAAVRTQRPAAVVTIDSPAFSLRLARRLVGVGVPVIHYVAPQVWAWRSGRTREMARILDHLIAVLPFEPAFFAEAGLPCTYVGHPVVESGADRGDGPAFRARHRLAPDAPVVSMLPGSRRGEIGRLLPVYGEAASLLAKRVPGLHVVLPTVPAIADDVTAAARRWSVPTVVVREDMEKYDAFAASHAAIAASGTVTLELALAGVPMIVAYRFHPVTSWLAQRLVRVPYACSINLVMERPVVPEFLLGECRPERLAEGVERLLKDATAAQKQQTETAGAMHRLGLGGPSPSARAAQVVIDVLGRFGAPKAEYGRAG